MDLFYREAVPANESAHIALNFWEFAAGGEPNSPISHEVFPDGCISLVYHQNTRLKITQNSVVGLSLVSLPKTIFADDKFWAMRVSPAAAKEFFGINPGLIQTQPISLLNKKPKNLEKTFSLINLCQDFTQAIEKFENWLKEDFPTLKIDRRMLKTVSVVTETFGQKQISGIAAEIGLSVRQLQRNFLSASGLTPKQFARVCRVRATAINLTKNLRMNWANRAAEIGFADQSHLAHELQNVTGRKPSDFGRIIKGIKHGELAG